MLWTNKIVEQNYKGLKVALEFKEHEFDDFRGL
jgi:hypothetical protein